MTLLHRVVFYGDQMQRAAPGQLDGPDVVEEGWTRCRPQDTVRGCLRAPFQRAGTALPAGRVPPVSTSPGEPPCDAARRVRLLVLSAACPRPAQPRGRSRTGTARADGGVASGRQPGVRPIAEYLPRYSKDCRAVADPFKPDASPLPTARRGCNLTRLKNRASGQDGGELCAKTARFRWTRWDCSDSG